MSGELQHRDEFEKMLQSEAESFGLKPSEGVWRKVKNALHPRDRGRIMPWLWLPLLLAATGIGGYFVFHGHQGKSILSPLGPGNIATAPALSSTGTPASSQRSAPAPSPGRAPVPSQGSITDKSQPSPHPLASLAAAGEKPHAASAKRRGVRSKPLRETSWPDTPPRVIPDKTGTEGQRLPVSADSHPGRSAALPVRKDSSVKIFNGNPSATGAPHADSLSDAGPAKHLGDDKQAVAAKQLVKTSAKKTGLRWEAYFTPAITYRFLHLPASSGINTGSLHDQPSTGFSAGILVNRGLKAGWGLATGLAVSQLEYAMNVQNTYPAYLNASGVPSGSLQQRNSFFVVANAGYNVNFAAASRAGSLYNSYFYIGIPLLVSYNRQLPNRWSLGFSAGAGIDYLAVKRANILSPGGRYFTDDSRVQRWNSLFRLSLSVGVPLGKRFSLDLGPDLHYQLFSTFGKYSVREHPYAIGLKLGLQVK